MKLKIGPCSVLRGNVRAGTVSKLVFFVLICLSGGGQVLQAQVREMVGRIVAGHEVGEVFVQRSFDRAGRLLSEERPREYCQQVWVYDSLGRVLLESSVCGESSSNGAAQYRYVGNKTFETSYNGLRSIEAVEESDAQGRVTKRHSCSTEYLPMEGEDADQCWETHYLYKNGQVVYEIRNPLGKAPDYLVLRRYSVEDSLTDVVEVELPSGKVLDHSQWKYSLEKRGDATIRTQWYYDFEDGVKELWSKTIHHLEPGNEWQVSQWFQDGEIISGEVRYYQEGLVTTQENYDGGGRLSERIRYAYTFW